MKRFLRSLLTGTSGEAANAAVDLLFVVAALLEFAFCLSASYGIYQNIASTPGARDGAGLLIVMPVVGAGGLLVAAGMLWLTQNLLGLLFPWWETILLEVNENEELYRLIHEGDEEVVVDVLTPLEILFATPGVFGAAMVTLGGAWFLYHRTTEAFALPFYGVPLLVVGAVLGRTMEVNLRLDLSGKTLQIFRRLHKWQWRQPICDFSEIDCVAQDSRYTLRQANKRRYHDIYYGLVIVLKNGKVVRAVDRDFQESTTVDAHGQRLASVLGVPYQQGAGVLKVRRTTDGAVLDWKVPSRTTSSERVGGCCAGIFLTLMLAGAAVKKVGEHFPELLNLGPVPSSTPTKVPSVGKAPQPHQGP